MTESTTATPTSGDPPPSAPPSVSPAEITRLRDLKPEQVKSGLAAWLGWLFDGLDIELYVLVAAPFVAELLGATSQKDPRVGYYSSLIQAAFLIGWALGGSFFGRIADRLGRSRALVLTILTYAGFTGLSYFAQTWWHLMIFRFLAALGIGGEWAVGAALLSETWPKRWRPWMAAVLQTAVNLGFMLAGLAAYLLAAYEKRTVFLVGILPALIVLWIRRAVPEPEEWHAAKRLSSDAEPRFSDLFRGSVRRTTMLCLIVCTFALSAHWAFMFWHKQHLRNLPEVLQWTEEQRTQFASRMLWLLMLTSIAGNFLAGFLARLVRYRTAIAILFLGYFAAMFWTYYQPRDRGQLWYGIACTGLCQGAFALFTMYLPPLFPTLLRTTGAGFCYNIGRIMAGVGTVVFGMFSQVGDHRMALLYSSFLFIPAAVFAWALPEPPDEQSGIDDKEPCT